MSLHSINIDVTKLDKSAFYQGQKGTYASLTIHIHDDGPDQYGNESMVTQDLGKERRLAGEKGPILGNGKWLAKGNGGKSQPAPAKTTESPTSQTEDDGDSIPF